MVLSVWMRFWLRNILLRRLLHSLWDWHSRIKRRHILHANDKDVSREDNFREVRKTDKIANCSYSTSGRRREYIVTGRMRFASGVRNLNLLVDLAEDAVLRRQACGGAAQFGTFQDTGSAKEANKSNSTATTWGFCRTACICKP